MKKINWSSIIIRAILAWLIIAFVIYPNINLLFTIFYKNGEFSTEVFGKVLKSSRVMKSMANSFILALSMVVSVNIVGTLIVLFTEYFEIYGSKVLKVGYMSSLVYGGVVLVTGYKFVYGANGILTKWLVSILPSLNPNWFQGYFAVIFIMTFACTSNHIIFLTNAIRGLDYHTIEAAKNMGASASTIFFKVVMPCLKPTFYAITVLTFLTGLGAMSAPLIVGGENFQTINPLIITFANSPYSREIAALLAVILGIMTIILLVIFSKIEKGKNFISVSKTKAKMKKQKITNPVTNIIAHAIAYLLFLIYMMPICLIVIFSFSDPLTIKKGVLSFSNLTLNNYAALFGAQSAIRPYIISISYSLLSAIAATIIAIAVVSIIRKSKNKLDSFYEYSVLIPWLLPSTLIALGLMMTYDVPKLIIGNKVLIGTIVIMFIGYVVTKLPFTFRMIRAAFFSIENSIEEAAKSMGSSSFNTLRKVLLPVIMPSILSVIVMNFNGKLADYDLSVFLYHPLYKPLGIVIKGASDETATSDAQAMAFVYSVILIIISSLALYLVNGEGMSKIKAFIKKRKLLKLKKQLDKLNSESVSE